MHANKNPICWIGYIEDVILHFLAIDVIADLIDERIIVELHGKERIDAVDGVVGCGYVGYGHVADDYGEDETDDGGEDLAAVRAGLPLLQVEIFEDEGLDLVA